MRYTLRQIEYFIATAETGSITLASERVNISQPSISTAIAHLEQELDTQLFVRRHAQGLTLTPAGKALLVEAKRLVEHAQQLYEVASEANDKIRGQLTLGCMVTLAPMIMPELSHAFTSAFPSTKVMQVVGDHDTLLQKLASAEIDVAITYDLHVPEGFDFVPLASLPPHVLVGEIHPFARLSAVTIKDIATEPLLLLDLPISREYFLAIFIQEGLTPHIAARSPHQDILRTMVANGYGYTLANVRPRSDTAMDGRKVVRVRLAGDHRPMVIGLVSPKERRKSRLIELFENHCRNRISDAYIPGMVAPVMEKRIRLD
ncbi:LysR family transcriptional regulator [Rhizobium sp. TRM95111]|uniref:LysR family transcriptional regulator n=1 Tax=Rhizobium alarense TaxID=2846851 RepID=UPI001F274DEC|nr:LysR family transcriptional regulator [Rhizobium alarense]MCF3641610.1 LysR family transcriptional regulator [Rhizobium alarense]